MRFFLPRRRQYWDGDMAEEGEEKDREKIPKIEDLVLGQLLSPRASDHREISYLF
jgi:hypothetical protein